LVTLAGTSYASLPTATAAASLPQQSPPSPHAASSESNAAREADAAVATCAASGAFLDIAGQGRLCRSHGLWVMRTRDGQDMTVSAPDLAATVASSKSPTVAASTGPLLVQQCVNPAQSPHVELYYAHFSGQPDNFGGQAGAIQQMFRDVDANFINYDATTYFRVQAHLFVECDGSLNPVVHDIALSTPITGSNFSSIVNDMKNQGHTSRLAHYWIWTDGNPVSAFGYAGQSTITGDDSASASNRINSSAQYSVNYGYSETGSGPQIFAHENGHAMGAVQLSAPDSTGNWHCTDGYDVMCYNDGGPNGARYTNTVCAHTPNGTAVFDCNFNDYFNPSPAAGSYLATHWNVASPNDHWLLLQTAASTTSITASPASVVFTQPVTLTATVRSTGQYAGAPTGSVAFYDGANAIGSSTLDTSAVATYSATSLGPGTHSLHAVYGGAGGYIGSSSSATTVSVSTAQSSLRLVPSSNPASAGTPLTLTAVASAVAPATGTPSGSVNFQVDGSPLGSATLNAGSASLTTTFATTGSHQLIATYSGDAGFSGSSVAPQTLTVLNASFTQVTSSASNAVKPGTAVTFTAAVTTTTGGAPTGSVTFFDGSSQMGGSTGLDSSGSASLRTSSLSGGAHVIAARYSGDSNHAGSTGQVTQIVTSPGPAYAARQTIDGSQQLVFWRGATGHLMETWYADGGWSRDVDWTPQMSSGGLLASAPTLALTSSQQLVFWQGANGHLWEMWYGNGAWGGPWDWTPQLPAAGQLTSAPSVLITPTQQLVFWQGANGHLWEMWYGNGAWGGPWDWTPQVPEAGQLASAPSVALTPTQQLVFWQGANGHLWEMWYGNGAWGGPMDWTAQLPAAGLLASAPAVAITSSQQLVFWQGANGHLWEMWYGNGGWGGPMDWTGSLPPAGLLASAPVVAVTSTQQLVFWQGANGQLWEMWYGNGGWGGPMDWTGQLPAGGLLATGPTVALTPSQQLVFWPGGNGHMWEMWYGGGGWGGPMDWNR
jgi:hypothetical protein